MTEHGLGYLHDHPLAQAALTSPLNWPISLLVPPVAEAVPPDYLDPTMGLMALDQGALGACVAFAATTVKQAEDRKDWGRYLYDSGNWTASPQSTGAFLGYWYLKHGTPDGSFPGDGIPDVEGSWPDAVWRMALKYGLPDATNSPHKISAFYSGMLQGPSDIAALQQVILRYGPVNPATPWPSNWMAHPAAPAYLMPPPSASMVGGHSWTIVGWNTSAFGRLMLVAVNSWGPNWTNQRGMFMVDPEWLCTAPLGPVTVWKPVDLPDAPKPPAPENKMLTALPNTTATPWNQLVDVTIGSVITSTDGRSIPLKSGGSGLWSPFAVSATARAVWFSSGGITQIGTVTSWGNMRPASVDIGQYNNAIADAERAVYALTKK